MVLGIWGMLKGIYEGFSNFSLWSIIIPGKLVKNHL